MEWTADHGQQVVSWIEHHARHTPDRVALVIWTGRELTYAELATRIRGLAWSLSSRFGVASGDRVAVLSRSDTRVFEVIYACALLGAVAVPLNWRLTPGELTAVMADAEPMLLVCESASAEVAGEVAAGAGVPSVLSWTSEPTAGGEAGSPDEYEVLAGAAVPEEWAPRSGGRGRGLDDHLHLGDDRAAQGRAGHPPRDAGQHAASSRPCR